MNYLELVSVPAIAIIVYILIEVLKKIFEDKNNFRKFIPLIAIGLGAVLGVITYFSAPTIIAADSVFMSILIGGLSGLTATGGDQIVKQLTYKYDEEKGKYIVALEEKKVDDKGTGTEAFEEKSATNENKAEEKLSDNDANNN